MDHKTKEIFTDQILHEAALKFSVSKEEVQSLGGFESFVFEYEKGGMPYILRITHSLHRSAEQIRAEMDWILYLSANGISVSRPVLSDDGNIVETIEIENAYFSVVSFEKAKGEPPGKDDFKQPLFRNMGRMMGKMHVLAKKYQPTEPACQRPEWNEEMDVFAHQFVHPTDPVLSEKFWSLKEEMKKLSKDQNKFGLIHNDFHRGNFHLHRGHITLFDFDDSQYSWFAEDIAMSLFYAVSPECHTKECIEFARFFYDSFLDGYQLENQLNFESLKNIPLFLKKREVTVYFAIKGSFPEDAHLTGWAKDFMLNRKDKIEKNIPYVTLDF